MLIGATALATSESAFAGGHGHKKSYEKNQATSQANACGNGKLPYNVFCQNIGSQVQGDENAVALDGAQQAGDNRHSGGNGNNIVENPNNSSFFPCKSFNNAYRNLRFVFSIAFYYTAISYNILTLQSI